MRNVVDFPQPDGPTSATEFLVGNGKIHVFHRVMDLSVILIDFAEYDFGHFFGRLFATESRRAQARQAFAAIISLRW